MAPYTAFPAYAAIPPGLPQGFGVTHGGLHDGRGPVALSSQQMMVAQMKKAVPQHPPLGLPHGAKLQKKAKKPATKKELEKRKREQERKRREKEKLKTKSGRRKKPKDPEAPRRARTAFNFFLDDFRKEYKRQHPESKGVVEVTKAGSAKWKAMSTEDKEPYESKAREAQEEYAAAKAKYEAEGGPKKFRLKGATKPKRPPTAYFMFLCSFRADYKAKNPGTKGIKDMSKAAGEKWRAMSAEEKRPFEQRALAAKDEYMRIKALPIEERQAYIENDNLYESFQTGTY